MHKRWILYTDEHGVMRQGEFYTSLDVAQAAQLNLGIAERYIPTN